MCTFHTSPDGFFWAGGEYSILLDPYAFDNSQQLLMCIYFILPRMDSFEQYVSLPFSWIVMFLFIRSSSWCVCFIIPRMDSFEQEVSLPFSWIVMFSIICSSCWCVNYIIPRMGSFEQHVSLPFSWIVMFSILCSSCWYNIFHTSPDEFFWAVWREYFILLDRYVFRLFAAAADVYISLFPEWILLSRAWVCHSLGSLCFR